MTMAERLKIHEELEKTNDMRFKHFARLSRLSRDPECKARLDAIFNMNGFTLTWDDLCFLWGVEKYAEKE